MLFRFSESVEPQTHAKKYEKSRFFWLWQASCCQVQTSQNVLRVGAGRHNVRPGEYSVNGHAVDDKLSFSGKKTKLQKIYDSEMDKR